MKPMRILAAIFFSVGLLSWLIGVILLYTVGSPMNISTDPDNPFVKSGRVKYMTKEEREKYENVRTILFITGVTGFIGAAIALKIAKRDQ